MIAAARSIHPGGSVTATLLAIDDSKTMRKVIEITFAGEDYRTVLSESASDALAKLRSEKPAVVLVDAILGETSGYDLCQRIKAEAPQVGVIILSSKQHPYDRAKGTAVGADDFIDKPFDTQALIDKTAGLAQRMADAPARPAATAAAASPAAAPRPAAAAAPQAAPHAPQPAAHQPTVARTGTAAPAPAARPAPQPTQATPAAAASAAQSATVSAAATTAVTSPGMASLESRLQGLGLTRDQVAGVLAISKDVVQQVVWEVVPVLAEAMIREEIQRLTAE
jgi:DNA-binding response OmpR family regulator